MNKRSILITASDLARLRSLLASALRFMRQEHVHLEQLCERLECAEVVSPQEIPPDVVTINSELQVKDLYDGREGTYTLVFPRDADISRNRISVLAPIGTFALGHRRGEVIEVVSPSGTRRLKIREVNRPLLVA